jgi:hypothetical protein
MKSLITNMAINLAKIEKEDVKIDSQGRKWLYVQIAVNKEPDQYGNNAAMWINKKAEAVGRCYIGNGKMTFFDSGTGEIWIGGKPAEEQPQEDILPF